METLIQISFEKGFIESKTFENLFVLHTFFFLNKPFFVFSTMVTNNNYKT